jgi:uncharacterized protein YndB with AHSA1/START domain
MEAVEREVTVPASPADVWPALTEPGEVSAWFGADAELDVRPGGRGTFRWPDGTERGVVVDEVEAERKLSFRWLPFQRTPDGAMVPLPSTRVEITLDEVAGGTRVRIVERRAFAVPAPRARSAGPVLATAAW